MKLASFECDGKRAWGSVVGDQVYDLGAVLGDRARDLKSALADGSPAAWTRAQAEAPRHAFSAITWLPVIPNAGKVLCVGLNYDDHRRETGNNAVGFPTIFVRFADSQTGHETDLVRPAGSTQLDYEGELAVIIGRGGRRIPEAEALAHIAGYACFNDGSVRDWQRHTSQFTPGKNFPATGGCGPWMVTVDEIADVQALELTTRVNGKTVQNAQTAQMIFSVARIVSYCSTFTPLAPGDVIATGTPGGVGARRTPPLFLKPGDRVEVEISGVGRLVNSVADENSAN
jgi:2-keto-4-pentenoate hydratase/2-oxohepta-3-ene-1,7-dioic acid hydratase in catechol pathway